MSKGGNHKDEIKVWFLTNGYRQKRDGTFTRTPLKSKWIKQLKRKQILLK